jgi:Zn-dependent protease with chaperone function
MAVSPSIPDAPAPPADASRERVERMLAALDQRIARVRVGIVYRLGLLVVAVLMIALPLVYLAMVGAVGYAVFYHAVTNWRVFEEMGARSAAVTYLVPLICGGLVFLFLIKPLLARRAGYVPGRRLKPEEQPLLFAFVTQLCKAVRAPIPSRIELDCQVNAAASPHGGLFNLLLGNLTLTIGLPLAQSLNLRQLTGVLAHEFGHFAQGGGMTLTYLIRNINGWFARVVYERDTWDEGLKAAGRNLDIRLIFIVWFVQLCVWLSRRVLWVLMVIGHFFSCFMLRQMEYDADRYEARVSGSDNFAETSRRIGLLTAAWSKTSNDLQHAWEEKRLGDNLPAMIQSNFNAMPENVRNELIEEDEKRRTGLFDTHPSTGRRIKRALREKAEGIFTDEGPASFLFRDFDGLCKTVTMDFYASVLGRDVVRATLVPTGELVKGQETMAKAYEAAARYSFGLLIFGQIAAPETTDMHAPENPKACALELTKQRNQLQRAAQVVREATTLHKDADKMRYHAQIAGNLEKARMRYSPSMFGLARTGAEAIRELNIKAERMREDAETEMHPMMHALRRRLACALKLLYVPQVQARLENARELKAEAEKLVLALRSIEFIDQRFTPLEAHIGTLGLLLQNLKGNEENTVFINQIRSQARKAQHEISLLHSDLKYSPYPFTHGQGEVSLSEYLVDVPPSPEDIGAVIGKGQEVMERCRRFYFRATGALVLIAEQVEAALGLPLLEPPEKTATPDPDPTAEPAMS